MNHKVSRQLHILHIGSSSTGRLIVYAKSYQSGTVTIYQLAADGAQIAPFYAEIMPYTTDKGDTLKAAVFPSLAPGNYKVMEPGYSYSNRKVTVFPGAVAEVDFR